MMKTKEEVGGKNHFFSLPLSLFLIFVFFFVRDEIVCVCECMCDKRGWAFFLKKN